MDLWECGALRRCFARRRDRDGRRQSDRRGERVLSGVWLLEGRADHRRDGSSITVTRTNARSVASGTRFR